MWDAASVSVDEVQDGVASVTAPPSATVDAAPVAPSGRYGDDRRLNMPVIVGVIFAHIAVFAAAAYFGPTVTREVRHRLQVVDVRLDPPPAPPSPPQPKEAPKVKLETAVAQPQPVIQLVSAVQAPMQIAPPAPVVAPPAPPAPPAPLAPPAPPSIVQGGNMGTKMVSGKPPRYPIECRRKREQGTVLLSLVVGVDGGVQTISIARSSGFASLDDAARDAVRKWRWEPTVRNGQPVMVRGVVEIPFVLQG